MPLLGAHPSIAGGLHKALEAAVALACESVQIFTKNASQWAARPLTDDEVRTFRKKARASRLKRISAHDSYLINLAAPGDDLYRKSIAAFRDEIERAEALGLSYLITHPGAHTGSGEDAGLKRVAAALDEVHTSCRGFKVKVLLETTAGQGSMLGHRFEQIARLFDAVKDPDRLGVCLDTCHVFAAGYPLGTDAEYDATMAEFDRLIGLKQIRVFHLNDSLKGMGCRVDRHAAIGLGQIGEHAFRRLLNDPRFGDRPMILETPKQDAEGRAMDLVNLAKLRALLIAGNS